MKKVTRMALLISIVFAQLDRGFGAEKPKELQKPHSIQRTKQSMETKNKETVKQFVEEFKNRNNYAILDKILAENFVHHMPNPGLSAGKKGVVETGQMVHSAFPDVNVKIQDWIVQEDKVVERSVVTATHKGEFFGVPATGKSVTWTETHLYYLKDGKIKEWYPEVNMLAILMQIGALPMPGQGK